MNENQVLEIQDDEIAADVDVQTATWERGELEPATDDPTIGVDVHTEEAGAGSDAAEAEAEAEVRTPLTAIVIGFNHDQLPYPVLEPAELLDKRTGLGISRQMLHALGDGNGGNGSLPGINGYRVWAAEQASKATEPAVMAWRAELSQILGAWDDGKPWNGVERPAAATKGRRPGSANGTSDNAEVTGLRDMVAALESKIADALTLVDSINGVKSLKEAKAVAAQVLEVLNQPESSTDSSDTTDNDSSDTQLTN